MHKRLFSDRLWESAWPFPDWLPLVVLAASLRLINLGVERLWYDETFTAYLTRLDPSHLWAAILGDNHPPTWYLLEWVWTKLFGASEFSLRLPSALLGILSVWLMWRLAVSLRFSRPAAFLSGLLLTVLPSALYYSQEARMYALLLASVLLMLDSAINERWGLFTLGGGATIYAHNVGAVYVLCIGLALLWQRREGLIEVAGLQTRLPDDPKITDDQIERAGRVIKSLMFIALGWLPWALWGLSPQLKQVHDGFWLPPLQLGDAFYPFLSMGVGTRMCDALQFVAYAGWACLIAAGLFASRRWLNTPVGMLFLSMTVFTPLIAIILSLTWRNIYVARTMLPAVALLVLPIAYALTHLSVSNRRVLALVALPVLCIGIVAHYFPDAHRGRGATDSWLQPIERGWQPGDVVYHLAVDSAIGTAYYAEDKASAVLPESTNLAQSLTDATRIAMGLQQVSFDALAAHGYRRAWLIVNDSPMISQYELDVWRQILARYPVALVNYDDPQFGLAASYMYLVPLGEVF